ncbi:MAG: hypothetical protein K2Y30_01845 [Flavobacteriaceae bacterium]|nr:hypothetical protein [Flavobacteriaceae bacterium]
MTTTKFHPILFSTVMVQAILENRKTQTRRLIKKKYGNTDIVWHEKHSGKTKLLVELQNDVPAPEITENGNTRFHVRAYDPITCPHNVGDILWVRETFRPLAQEVRSPRFEYKATEEINLADKWKPSLFMPKEACRLFLKIKSIRVERLQDISEEDAISEGAKDRLRHSDLKVLEGLVDWTIPSPFASHQFGFLAIWCTINGCKNWLENPFVWVYEFEKIEKPLDFIV